MKKTIGIAAACGLAAVMTFSVFADSFVPSIHQKLSPEISQSYIVSESGKKTVIPVGEIIVRAKPEADEKTAEILDNAYSAIKEAKSVTDAIEGLSDYLKEKKVTDIGSVVVRDLFYVSYTGKTAEVIKASTGKVTVRLELNLPKDAFACAAIYDEEQWKVVPEEATSITEDGCLDIVMGQECAVAVLTQKQ